MSRFSTDASLLAAQNSSLDASQAAWQASTGTLIEREIDRQRHSWSRDGLLKTLGKATIESSLIGSILGYDAGTGAGIDAVSNWWRDNGLGVQSWSVNTQDGEVARDDMGRVVVDPESVGLGMTSKTLSSLAFGFAGRADGFKTYGETLAVYGSDDQGNPFDIDTLRNMADAGSEVEMAYIRALAIRKQEVAQRTARVPGIVNFGVSMAAGFTDPIMLASGMAAGAIGRPIAGLALTESAGTVRRLVVNGLAAGGENIAQGSVLSGINNEPYTAHQAVLDFSLGLAFSTTFEGVPEGINAAIKSGNGASRMQVAMNGLTTTPKGDAYFSEVPGHTPTARPADLANADKISASALFNDSLSGEAIDAPKWLVGREVYVDGLNAPAKVVRVEGGDVVVAADGREVRMGMDGVALNRAETFTKGARVQLRDGTTGTVHEVGGDTVTVMPDTVGQSVPGESRIVNQSDLILKQGPVRIQRGQISFDANGRAVIAFLKAKNASTLVHESGHLFRRTMRDIDAAAADELNALFGEAGDSWSVKSEEHFARLFEKYMREGKAPTEGLRAVFAKFKSWMADLIDSAKGLKLTDKHRDVFGILLDSKGDKPIIGTLDGPEGVMYRKVRGELDKVLTDRTEADAVDALIQANARAWSRATGKPIGAYYRDVLVGFTDTKAAPGTKRTLSQEDGAEPAKRRASTELGFHKTPTFGEVSAMADHIYEQSQAFTGAFDAPVSWGMISSAWRRLNKAGHVAELGTDALSVLDNADELSDYSRESMRADVETIVSAYEFLDANGVVPSRSDLLKTVESTSPSPSALGGRGQRALMQEDDNPQLRTPEFKAWFGESTVVDSQGKPKVVYHGSDAAREVFNGGVFWTDSLSDASAYAELKAMERAVDTNSDLSEIVSDILAEEGADALSDLGPQRIREIADANGIELDATSGGHVTEAYLSVQNPLDLRSHGSDVGDVESLWNDMHEQGFVDEGWNSLDEYVQDEIRADYDGKALYTFLEKERIQAKAFTKGYDAVVFVDVSPDGGSTHSSWLVKESSQSKSATGNSGAFDPKNPNILAQEDIPDAPEAPTDSRVLVLQKGLGAGRAWKAFGIVPRLTRAGILKGNDSAIGNQIVSWLMDDPTLDQSGTRNVSTVESNARMNRDAIFGTYARDIRAALEEHLKPLGVKARLSGKEADAFLRRVGEIVGDPNGKADSPEMEKAVAATRSALKDLLKLGKSAGIKGFENIDPNDFYFTRRWDHVRILNLIGEIDKAGGNGKAEVTELLAKAFLDENPKATDIDEARVLAEAFLLRLQQVSRAGPIDKAMMSINLDNAGIMREILTEAQTDPAVIENIMRRFAIPTEGTNLLPQAKFRTRLNDRASHTTAGGRSISMTDLLDTNALNVVEGYAHGVTAEAALTQLRKAVADLTAGPDGPVPIDSDAQLLVRYKKALEKDGGLSPKAVARNVWLMETAIKRIKGLPIDEGGSMSDMLWRFRAFNSITGSAGFCVSAAFEMGGAVARIGLKPMAQHFPEMVQFAKNLRTGQPNDALTRTVLSSLGLGQDMATNRLLLDMGLADDAMAPRSEKVMGGIDKGLSGGRRIVSEWSGMPQITAIIRLWAARGMLQRISDQVRTGKMPSAKRLAALGLDESAWKAIAEQIKTHAKHADTKLTDLNLDAWTDLSAKQKMLAAVRDSTLTTIQESSVGNSHPWLETELGRTIFQFRQFAFAALEKQMYSNVQVMDGESAALFVSGPVLGLMQYLAMTYLNGIGREDRDEYWAKMTTPTRLGIAAFNRASFSSLVPTAYDTVAVSLGYPGMSGFRSGGLDSDPILGNRSLQLLTRGRRGLFSPFRAMMDSGYKFSKEDASAMRLLAPAGTFPGMSAIYNSLTAPLPAKSQPEFGQ